MILDVGERRIVPFCALEYRQLDVTEPSSHDGKVIIMLLRLRSGRLRMLVRSDWRGVVRPEDHDYIADILSDFKQRAKNDPGGLFQQAKSLAVGPIVTHAAGNSIAKYPELMKRCDDFAEALPYTGFKCSPVADRSPSSYRP